MTRYLTVEQALRIARTAVGGPIQVRDVGLLEAAVHRPRASVLGHNAYRDLFTKAAALMHLLARNQDDDGPFLLGHDDVIDVLVTAERDTYLKAPRLTLHVTPKAARNDPARCRREDVDRDFLAGLVNPLVRHQL